MSWKELFKLNPWSFSIALLLQMAGVAGEIGVAYFLTLQFNAVRNRNLQMFVFWTVLQIICYVFVYLFIILQVFYGKNMCKGTFI